MYFVPQKDLFLHFTQYSVMIKSCVRLKYSSSFLSHIYNLSCVKMEVDVIWSRSLFCNVHMGISTTYSTILFLNLQQLSIILAISRQSKVDVSLTIFLDISMSIMDECILFKLQNERLVSISEIISIRFTVNKINWFNISFILIITFQL